MASVRAMREALNDTSITHVVLLDRPGGYVLTEEDFPKDSIWIDGRDVLLEGKGPNPVYLDVSNRAFLQCGHNPLSDAVQAEQQ